MIKGFVKASERKPEAFENRLLHVLYKGKPDLIFFLDGLWHWYEYSRWISQPTKRVGAGIYIKIPNECWPFIEWLDESVNPALQETELVLYRLYKSLEQSELTEIQRKRIDEAKSTLTKTFDIKKILR